MAFSKCAKVKAQDLLNPTVSDRTLQIATLFQHEIEVFERVEMFKEWLKSPLIALGQKQPYELMNNSTGIAIIHDLLGRIEHGIYS
ncbi:MAG: DUF2384 domain-containing protein [Reichenbachiella sp.]